MHHIIGLDPRRQIAHALLKLRDAVHDGLNGILQGLLHTRDGGPYVVHDPRQALRDVIHGPLNALGGAVDGFVQSCGLQGRTRHAPRHTARPARHGG